MEIKCHRIIIPGERIFIPMSEENKEVDVEYIGGQTAKILIISNSDSYKNVRLVSTQNVSIEMDVEDGSIQTLKLCQGNTLYKIIRPDFGDEAMKGIVQKIQKYNVISVSTEEEMGLLNEKAGIQREYKYLVDILTEAESESDKAAQDIYAEHHPDKKVDKCEEGVKAEMAQVYFAFWLAIGTKLVDVKHERQQRKHNRSKKSQADKKVEEIPKAVKTHINETHESDFPEEYARKVMKVNDETKCMVVSTVQKDKTVLSKQEIMEYMKREKLSSFF